MIEKDMFDKLIELKVGQEIHRRQIPVIQAILKEKNLHGVASLLNNWNTGELYFSSDHLHRDFMLPRVNMIDDMRILRKDDFYFKITQDFGWDDGDFDDEDSCYWDDRASAKDMILAHDGFAVCFFNSRNGKLGRCWGAPIENGIVIWNAYGPFYCSTIASVLADYFEKPFWPVRLDNRGSTDGMLYINNYYTYWIGDEMSLNKHLDLDWDELGVENCTMCGRSIYPWMDETDEMCADCRYEYYFYCDHCGEYAENGTHTFSNEFDYICQKCAPKFWSDQCKPNPWRTNYRTWRIELLDGTSYYVRDFNEIVWNKDLQGFTLNGQKTQEMGTK